jgi:uncharacterized coiled-coil DUF342 family protein
LDLEGHDKAIEKTKMLVAATQSELNSILEARITLESETNRLRSERAALNEQVEESRLRIADAKIGIAQIEAEVIELRASHTASIEVEKGATSDLEEARQKFLQLEKERDDLQIRVNASSKTAQEAISEWTSIREEIDSIKQEITSMEAQILSQMSECKDAVDQTTAARPGLGLLQLKLEGLKDTQVGHKKELLRTESREQFVDEVAHPQPIKPIPGEDLSDIWGMPSDKSKLNTVLPSMNPSPNFTGHSDEDIFFSRAESPNSVKSLPTKAPDLLGSFGSMELARPHTQPIRGFKHRHSNTLQCRVRANTSGNHQQSVRFFAA